MRSLPRPKIVNTYEVLYLAGYSKNASIVYIDKRVPRFVVLDGTRIDLHRYLAVHEEVEKELIDKFAMNYQTAHAIAEKAEKEAVTVEGHDFTKYELFMDTLIANIYSQPLTSSPPDLDLTPYVDSNDTNALMRIKKVQK